MRSIHLFPLRGLVPLALAFGWAGTMTVAWADEPAPTTEAAAAPAPAEVSPETRAALDAIQEEADRKRADREELERLRREVDRGRGRSGSATSRRRPALTQSQIRALRAQQRRQFQAAWRGVPLRAQGMGMNRFPGGGMPFPPGGNFSTFRMPNGQGFAGFWMFPGR